MAIKPYKPDKIFIKLLPDNTYYLGLGDILEYCELQNGNEVVWVTRIDWGCPSKDKNPFTWITDEYEETMIIREENGTITFHFDKITA